MSTNMCTACHATSTPLWRRGPGGCVLCNACGVKWIRNPQMIRLKMRQQARHGDDGDGDAGPAIKVKKHKQSHDAIKVKPDRVVVPNRDHPCDHIYIDPDTHYAPPDSPPAAPRADQDDEVKSEENDREHPEVLEGSIPTIDPAPPAVADDDRIRIRRSSRERKPARDIYLEGYVHDELVHKKRHNGTELPPKVHLHPRLKIDPIESMTINFKAQSGLKCLQITTLKDTLASLKSLPPPQQDFDDAIRLLKIDRDRLRNEAEWKMKDLVTMIDSLHCQCGRYQVEIDHEEKALLKLTSNIADLCHGASVDPTTIMTMLAAPCAASSTSPQSSSAPSPLPDYPKPSSNINSKEMSLALEIATQMAMMTCDTVPVDCVH